VNAYERVTGANVASQRFATHETLHRVAQVLDLLPVDRADLGQCALRFEVA
jgi:hypothetical protein